MFHRSYSAVIVVSINIGPEHIRIEKRNKVKCRGKSLTAAGRDVSALQDRIRKQRVGFGSLGRVDILDKVVLVVEDVRTFNERDMVCLRGVASSWACCCRFAPRIRLDR